MSKKAKCWVFLVAVVLPVLLIPFDWSIGQKYGTTPVRIGPFGTDKVPLEFVYIEYPDVNTFEGVADQYTSFRIVRRHANPMKNDHYYRRDPDLFIYKDEPANITNVVDVLEWNGWKTINGERIKRMFYTKIFPVHILATLYYPLWVALMVFAGPIILGLVILRKADIRYLFAWWLMTALRFVALWGYARMDAHWEYAVTRIHFHNPSDLGWYLYDTFFALMATFYTGSLSKFVWLPFYYLFILIVPLMFIGYLFVICFNLRSTKRRPQPQSV